MRFAVVATAVDASVLLLCWCPGVAGVVVTGEATHETRALVCSSSSLSLQNCSVQRPAPFTSLQMSLTSGHCMSGWVGHWQWSLSGLGSLVWSRLGMVTLAYHK